MHHNNYYFIRNISGELSNKLVHSELFECYSQNKDELVLAFILPGKSDFFILSNLGSEFSCLQFPEELHRAKRNTITLFDEVIGLKIIGIKQYENERAFALLFENEYQLVFKLFGNRSNIILYHRNDILKIFKNSLKQDKSFYPIDKKIELSQEVLKLNDYNVKKVIYTFDDLFIDYLKEIGYDTKSETDKYSLLSDLVSYLNKPKFYITKWNGRVVLSLVEIGEVIKSYSNSIEAINAFYFAHFKYNFLENRKDRIRSKIQQLLKSSNIYLEKTLAKRDEISLERSPSQFADIIMANIHAIPQGANKIKLFDFYSNEEIEIKLKPDMSSLKYAELLYKKARKRPLELANLNSQITNKEKQLLTLEEDLLRLYEINTHKELEELELKYAKAEEKEDSLEKFKNYEVMGFKILVGRNADNNDELTQKFATKNDLWLHAKDVTGSHVVIKFQAGKNFPKPVIEAAAGLAAYYSKRKNESLCPVIYTEKKFVRKVKGAPKGAVKIEKESVMMVTPRDL